METYIRAEVFDGRGLAHIWRYERRKRGADRPLECVGTVYGVHTEAEALAAWRSEQHDRPFSQGTGAATWR